MKHEQPTLIILTPGFPASETETNCLPMQQRFIRTIKQTYPSLNIFVLSFQYPFIKKTYKWFDVTILAFNGHNKGGLFKILLRRKLNAALSELNKNYHIMGILSFWYGECALMGKRFGERNNIRHYCWISGQDARVTNKYPARIKLKSTEMIALSDFLQNEFEYNHQVRPAFVIPPGIDLAGHSLVTQERNIDIIAAGSLIPLKRFEMFLEIIAEIKKQVPDVKAVLVGDGPEKANLETHINKHGLEKNITLAGEIPHPVLLQMMQRSKILLHTSSYEGFSGVCQEALFSGAYVISFCWAMKQEIDHWYIAENIKDMIQKTLELLNKKDIIYNPVVLFTMENSARQIMKLFMD